MRDPFPQVAGGGFALLREAGIVVNVGLEAEAARVLNAPYLKRLATGRPFVTAKWAMTLDGKLATATGNSGWISGARSRTLVHELRGRMDAIVVGIGTVLADDPLLTARPPGPRLAARVVLDSEARLPLGNRLVSSSREAPVWVAVTDRAPADRRDRLAGLGCEILPFPGAGSVPILPLLEEMGKRGFTNVLVEGGGRTLGAFFDAGQVDAVDVFLAPILEGGSHDYSPVRGTGVALIAEAARLKRHAVSQVDGDVRVQGTLHPEWLADDSP
jgi:diaminohydroxyphosphoribosylaminopyrimidine deaminase/5-amino-6-(5-phosphoribosylamino)uracil reductase